MIGIGVFFRALMGSRIFWYGLLIAGALWPLAAYRSSLIQDGYDKRVAEEQVERLVQAEADVKEFGIMAQAVKGAQDAYTKQGDELATLRERLHASDERMRAQKADFERRIKTASADSLRKYAEASDRNLEGCRGHVERFGLEAANCARSAEALKTNLDTITVK